MPANSKYLASTGQRALKITAGILGGYILAEALHILVGTLVADKGVVVITGAYTTFFVWISLMILAFLSKNGWKIWGIYLLATLVCAALIYFLR